MARVRDSKWAKPALAVGGVGVVLLGCVGFCLPILFFDLCENELISESASPNGAFRAVSFSRGCGATTGINTQVSILPARQRLPNDGGNVFVADGQLALELRWLDDQTLHIGGLGLTRIYRQETLLEGIRITYE